MARRLDTALADSIVGAVLFQFDSPGGEVAGAYELAAHIYAARGVKPMSAVVSDVTTSGAYLQAAAVGDIPTAQPSRSSRSASSSVRRRRAA